MQYPGRFFRITVYYTLGAAQFFKLFSQTRGGGGSFPERESLAPVVDLNPLELAKEVAPKNAVTETGSLHIEYSDEHPNMSLVEFDPSLDERHLGALGIEAAGSSFSHYLSPGRKLRAQNGEGRTGVHKHPGLLSVDSDCRVNGLTVFGQRQNGLSVGVLGQGK